MSLIGNERTKLVANALDRASTACFAIGVFSPIVATIYADPTVFGPRDHLVYVVSLCWIAIGLILHLGAQYVLGRLK